MVKRKFFHKEYPFKSNFIDINGIKMHYIDEGKGVPVLMVHGNPTWSFFYRKVISKLSKDFRCIAPDHIGCGLSDKPQNYSYKLEDHINNIDQLLKKLKIDKFNLVVHDWGGAIGFGIATKYPEKINKIIAMNTAAFCSNAIPWQISLCRIPIIGEFILRKLNIFVVAARYMAVSKVFRLSKNIYKGYVFPYNNYENRVGVARFVQDIPLKRTDESYKTLKNIENNLKKLKGKDIMLFWGAKDFCFTTHFMHIFEYFFENAKTVEIKDAGHYVLEDLNYSPEIIEKFLKN